jgi:hypothetical protein
LIDSLLNAPAREKVNQIIQIAAIQEPDGPLEWHWARGVTAR